MPIVSWTFSVHINVKPEEAFAYVADLTRHSEWSSGPPQSGARFARSG